MRANGSMAHGGMCGSRIFNGSPEIVGGCQFHLQCEGWHLHQHALLWGPMTPGSLVAGGSPASSLIDNSFCTIGLTGAN